MAQLQVLLVIHVGNVGEEKEKFHYELGEIKSLGKNPLASGPSVKMVN